MPSSYLILCRPLLLLPPIPPSIRVFSNESTLRMRWPKYWSFSFSIMPSKEIPGLISYFFLNIHKYCFHKIFYFREYIFFINCKYFQRMLLYLQQQVNPMTLRLNKVGVYFLISVGGALLCAIMQSLKLTEAQPSSLWSSQIHLTLSSCGLGKTAKIAWEILSGSGVNHFPLISSGRIQARGCSQLLGRQACETSRQTATVQCLS